MDLIRCIPSTALLPIFCGPVTVHGSLGENAERKRQMFQKTPRSTISDAVRSTQIAWLDGVLEQTGWTLSKLARESGATDTTLTRFRNNPSYSGRLSQDVIAKIVARTGIAGPELPGIDPTPRAALAAFREDGTRYVVEPTNTNDAVVTAALRGRNDAAPWVMKSDVLALAGVRAGDILIIDMAATPKDGDIVCAQHEIGLGARTLFRILQTPNLCAASFDPLAEKPLQIDGGLVRVVGVMTDLIRRRS